MQASARAGLYGFFSRLLTRELNDEAVELLHSPLGAELLPEYHASSELEISLDREQRCATFDVDFVHLTVVNVVPYASFYLRADAMVEGASSNPVAEFMRAYGFEVDLERARALAPDHIGVVLEFMATLCEAEAEAQARPDEAYAAKIHAIQRQFLQQHVVNWAPVYLFAVERCAHTTLYREVARVCMDFIGADYELLSHEAEV